MSTLQQENTGGLRRTRWAHWPRRTDCPYYQMFYGAMRVHGVVPVVDLEPTVEWLDGGSADVIHVHWPEGLWRHHRRGLAARARGVVAVTRFLRTARARGVRVVWTVHNLGAHEGGDWIDTQGYRVVAPYSDLIICHTRGSIEETIRRYRLSGSVVLMPLGNYDGVYPEPRPRQDVLAQLGLDPGRPVLSCLGYLRAYKGLELACKAVSRLGDTVQLVVAGPPYKKYALRPLRRAVDALPYARLSSCVMPVADWIQQRHQGTARSTGPCAVAQA